MADYSDLIKKAKFDKLTADYNIPDEERQRLRDQLKPISIEEANAKYVANNPSDEPGLKENSLPLNKQIAQDAIKSVLLDREKKWHGPETEQGLEEPMIAPDDLLVGAVTGGMYNPQTRKIMADGAKFAARKFLQDQSGAIGNRAAESKLGQFLHLKAGDPAEKAIYQLSKPTSYDALGYSYLQKNKILTPEEAIHKLTKEVEDKGLIVVRDNSILAKADAGGQFIPGDMSLYNDAKRLEKIVNNRNFYKYTPYVEQQKLIKDYNNIRQRYYDSITNKKGRIILPEKDDITTLSVFPHEIKHGNDFLQGLDSSKYTHQGFEQQNPEKLRALKNLFAENNVSDLLDIGRKRTISHEDLYSIQNELLNKIREGSVDPMMLPKLKKIFKLDHFAEPNIKDFEVQKSLESLIDVLTPREAKLIEELYPNSGLLKNAKIVDPGKPELSFAEMIKKNRNDRLLAQSQRARQQAAEQAAFNAKEKVLKYADMDENRKRAFHQQVGYYKRILARDPNETEAVKKEIINDDLYKQVFGTDRTE